MLVHLVTRGKPAARSGAVPGVSPQSRPRASKGDGGAGKGRRRKRTPRCHGVERGTNVPPRRQAADFLRV